MKYQIKPLVIAISIITSSVVFADEPTPSNPDATTIQYQGGETHAPIVEKSGHTGINNLIIKDVKINNIDESQLAAMSLPAIVSLGGNNGSFAGTASEHQKYGNLDVKLDKNTEILANLTNTDSVIGVYSRTDSPDGTNTITSDATINITSNGNVTGISSQNFSNSSGNGDGGTAILHLTENSNITVSGTGKTASDSTIAAQAQGDNTVITNDKGSHITVIGQTGSDVLKGLESWGYNGTSSVTNNGTINIEANLSGLASSTAIDASSKDDNLIIHNGTIGINGGGFNNGIKGYSQNGTTFIQTSKDSLIEIKSPNAHMNNGIKVTGDNNLTIAGDITIEGGIAYGISANNGSSMINQSGNIQVTSKNVAIGVSAQATNTGNKALIQSSGDIKVTSSGLAAGIYSLTDSTSNVIYDNVQGHIEASSGTDTNTSKNSIYGIVNMSISGTANAIIKNIDYISATSTTGDNQSTSIAIQNASINGDSYVGVIGANQITASSSTGSATAIDSMVGTGTGKSQIDLSHINSISAEGNHDVLTITSQNEAAGDSIINIDNTVNQITSTSVTNTGKNAAIHASSNEGNSIITSAAKNISTSGIGNHAILSESQKGNSQVTTSSHISATGMNSSGIYATTNEGSNTVTLASGANVIGGAGDNSLVSGVLMTSQTGDQELNIASGAKLSSLNDSAINSNNTSGKTTINNSGTITGYANFTGTDVTFNNRGGTLNLQDFSSGSKGTISYNIGDTGTGTFNNEGTIQFGEATLDGNTNHAIFNVATFNNNTHGIIDLTGKNPASKNNLVGDTFTINGNYVSNGGSLYLNTLLDDASSNAGKGTSDQLQIQGDVTTGTGGATKIYIMPTANSLGQLTTGDGIKVVDVQGTSSANAFALDRRLTAGAYEYTLNQGSSDDSWYLSSFYHPTGGGSGTGQIMYSPSIGAYLANQTAAVEMFQQTLFDRLISASGFDHDASKQLFWLRTSMTHGNRRSVNANFSNRNRSYMMQLGGDLGVWQLNDGYLHVGLMAGYGDAKNTSTSRLTRTEADGKVKGYSTGIYGTWFQNQDTNLGLYIDTWSQMGWYRNEVSGEAQIGTKKYNSTVWSNSIETGYGISLTKSSQHEWIATPQLQLTYNLYDADNQKDKNNLHVSNNKASGLETRTGVRLHDRGLQKKTIEPFVEMNWLHTTADNQLTFNGEKLRDGLPQNRFETKVGLQGDINDQWSVSAQEGGQWGQNHFNQYQGQLNVNYKW